MKEDAPTNSMSGVYSLNAPGHRVGPKDKAQIFYPDVDGNFTDGIPGNPGDPFYVRPEGYWKGGNQWSEQEVPDASQEYLDNDPTGKSTGDLIAEDGTVKTFLPPDSRHFILGPLVDGYVVNHGYDNYSNIGYIQKDTRQFVLLARIQGQFTADLHQEGARVWDGTSEQLTIYNANFTLAMAEWFRDQITGGKSTSNVPYFYSGGVPQQPLNNLQCPSCPPNMFGGVTPGTGGGFGQGTPPSLGSQQAASQSGNQNNNRFYGEVPPIPRGNTQYDPIGELMMLGLSFALAKLTLAALTSAASGLRSEVAKTIELWKATGPNAGKTITKPPTKIQYPTTPKPTVKVEPQPSPTGRPGISRGRGMGDRWEGPLSNSYQPNGELIVEGIQDLPVELIHVVNSIIAEIGNDTKALDKLIKIIKRGTPEDKTKDLSNSYEPPKFIEKRERQSLTETRTPKQRRLLREIKQPVKVKETPTKYKMNFSGKYSPQNTPSATASSESDALVASGNEKGRKWKQEDKYWSGYETTERMNVIHDRVGHGSQYWDRMLDEAKEKNNWRTREVQEELNKIAHEKAMLKENPNYRSPFGEGVEVEDTTAKNVKNFEKVTKIKKVVSDTKFFNNKEIKPEYPEGGQNKKKLYEDIAIEEVKYLRYFVENFSVPKYYDWRTGEFNELAGISKVVLKRLGTIEDALSEGMTTKVFKYLYGGVVTHDIVSINPNLVSSTFAQDLIGASSQVTSHMFGPEFPGSHINSIGDFKPQSYSKVDVLATASWNSLQDVTPSGWTPENSFEYYGSVSDVVSSGQETDTFKDTHFGEVTVDGTSISLSTGDDEDSSQENTVDIEDLRTLFPGVTFPTGHPMPGETAREDPIEASMLLRTFKSVKVGQEISFNYSFTSAETEEGDDVTYRGVPNTDVPGDDGLLDDYAFVLIAGRVQKIVSVMARDGNNLDFNFQANDNGDYKPDILQSRFPLTGRYSYTVKQDDIDDHGNLKLFVGVMDAGDGNYESNLDITNFELDSKRSDAGELGEVTDAFDLGYRAETPAELRKRLKSSEVASDIEKLGTQAKTYIDYLTGKLPDTIDNEYLGQKYVNSIFKDAVVNDKGKISVGDNVVGTGGEATYDPKTGQITIPFNYDFNTNAQEIAKNPERFGNSAFDKTVRAIAAILGGDYALDSLPVVPAGYATTLAKLLGGAKHRPGKVTMSADKVNKLNPLLHAQVVGTTGLAKEELYPGQPSPNGFPDTPPPKMINGRHPEFGKRSNRYRRLDPISAKTMSMIKTGDPETDKQVNDQAKKPKVEGDSTWSNLKKYR